MRDIKFRGKRIDNKEWVCGDIVFHYENQRKFILCDQMAYTYTECGIGRIVSEHYFEVIPETIGQYTGLKDKNGTEIYEGDILSTDNGTRSNTGQGLVKEYKGMYVSFYGQDILERDCYDALNRVCNAREVIGNIWENPELLK